MSKIIRVNMSNLTVKEEAVPEKYNLLGGRGLTSQIVYDEVPPLCHPIGPNNKLVIAPGIVTGTAAPSSGRVSVGGKSPLTNTIKESNAGTKTSQFLARLGIKAIIIEGQPKDKNKKYLLKVNKTGLEIVPADELSGLVTSATVNKLLEKHGDKVGVMCIGPAGEWLMANAGVCFNDTENRATRYSGRGGLGAVLGSKGVKAMVVDAADTSGIKLADEAIFREGQKKLVEALRTHWVTKPGGALNSYGTAVLVNVLNEAGGFPTRNFSSGRFEGAAKISGEAIAEMVKIRGGKGTMGHSCHPGCIIRCSNVYPNPDGSEMVSVQEYESVWGLGANCGIDNLDVTGELIKLCNEIGLDTIEAGVTLGVAMEGGLANFGDGKKAIELMQEIGKGSPLGRILGQGASFTAKALGVARCPTVKDQGMPAYEPRAVKGIGITYCTTPMGADHTAGYTIAPEILSVGGKADPLSVKGKADTSRGLQAATAFLDSTGYCLFTAFAILDIPSGLEGMVETCNGVLDTKWTVNDVGRIGLETMRTERNFNEAAGFSKLNDRIPEFMKYEPLPPHNHVFDVPDSVLDNVWEF
ncbi:MAG: putative oxidoreductase YdhV [candidate division WS2 bacterium]|uniref:Oxidoreductase YdhV n=1 Tax=Psychracetigena formicireducens TaxID=2986056 RepID=A0A9E2BIX7_PSYF1|nr:putative oxidoreductase YdhV [Candidatus Psychracetigena formicireducens]MBT9150558.1 putative oxidoreductase YdhV [Candidatus Psychracetigena formicireducens]